MNEQAFWNQEEYLNDCEADVSRQTPQNVNGNLILAGEDIDIQI